MLTVLASAKLNLTLEVLVKRQDGYHEIRSVIQSISLCDSLHFQLSQSLDFRADKTGWIPEQSLVSKAATLLKEATGCTKGVRANITKRIPLVSGLGGDSSDAVATLAGLNELWGLGLMREELLELAVKLGSDTAFFLYGGTALAEGRGEIVTSLPSLPHMWVVLVVPSVPELPEKTKQLYASLEAADYTDGHITQRLVEELKAGREFTPSLHNVFEKVAFKRFPEIRVCRECMVKAGAADIHLAGSGPTLFTLLKNKTQAEELYLCLQQQGLETYQTETAVSTMVGSGG